MDSEKFVKAIEEVVISSTITGVQQTLESPPGRSPTKDLLDLSRWYNSLSETDRQMVAKIIS